MRLFNYFAAAALAVAVSAQADKSPESPAVPAKAQFQWVDVAGSGIHYFSTAIVHSEEATDTGMIKRTTETVDLSGDIIGRVLYQPESVINFDKGKLTNTGNQVFSGTILGSPPLMLHDDEFRFDVNLESGETIGRVFLVDRVAGPRARCNLTLIGSGMMTAEGDSIVDYTGKCKVRKPITSN